MSANGKKRDKGFIALLVLIIVCACLMIAAITTLGIGMSNGDLSDDPQTEQPGNRGSVWHKGKGVPGNDLGVEGDYYLNEETGDVYCKSATGWGDVVLNMKGSGGKAPEIKDGYWWVDGKNTNVRAEAADGITPHIGLDGYWYFGDTKSEYKAFPTMTSGSEAPNDANGAIGDLYVQTAEGTTTFYQKGTDGHWKDVVTVEAAPATDVNGSVWYTDTGAPTNDKPASAKVGDFYLDTATGNVYMKGASGWGDSIGNLHKEPAPQEEIAWYFGEGDPNTITQDGNPTLYGQLQNANVGDFYLDNETGEIYKKGANKWDDTGISMKGDSGSAGNKWYSGTGKPTQDTPSLKDQELHKGDVYFDTENHLLYTYDGSAWGDGVPFGETGATGNAQKWLNGQGDPNDHTPVADSKNGDFYIDTTTGKLYQRQDAEGVEKWTDLGITIQGSAGNPGTKWYYGTVAPENNHDLDGIEFHEGDIYYDTANHNLYTYGTYDGVKGWGEPVSFGAQGAQGTPGTKWYHGESKPSAEDPAEARDGDYYFDSSSNIIYIKEAGNWTELVNLTVEPEVPHIEGGEWWVGNTPTGIPARGEKGEDGKTPSIGDDNHWHIGDQDLGPAVGPDGKPGETPFINDEGYWQIGDYVTPHKAAGEDGKNGTVWHSDAGVPVTHETDVDGEIYTGPNVYEGDFYLDTNTGDVYVLEGDAATGTWEKIVTLRDTITNVHGAWYLNGRPTGFYVSTWHTGEGEPNALKVSGVYGDLYLDTLTGDVYVSNAALGEESASWTKKLNIKGERGNYLYSGKGEPVLAKEQEVENERVYVADAKNGDMYLNTVTGYIYQMQGDAWVKIFETKGAQGDRGSKWFNGKETPVHVDGALVGDYYFETKHGIIYTLTSVDAEGVQTWQPVNSDDPLAGTKWLSGEVDPADVTDEALKALLDDANDWDVYFNTVEKTIWQKKPQPSGESAWELLGKLTDSEDRGTVWYYGTYDPILDAKDEGFIKATAGHIKGDFYLQTYYPFSGYTGFRIYIFEDNGHGGVWNMHVDMRSGTGELSGTEFEIPNYDALRAFRDSVNGVFGGKANNYTGNTVTLTGIVTIPEDENFGMIAGTEDTPFKGTFDGGTEVLYIEGQGLKGPLFGYIDGATIKNLHVKAKLDEATLSTFALGGKTSLLTNTYGIAVSAEGTTFTNVTLELENNAGKVVVTWDESGNVSVTVTGKTPAAASIALSSASDYLLVIRNQKLLLGNADFTFEHVKFEDNIGQSTYIDVTNAKSLTLIDCYADVTPVEACRRNPDGSSDEEGELMAGSDRSGNAAFIVSRPSSAERAPALELTVKDSTILSAQSTADNDAALPGRRSSDTDSMAILINTKLAKATITGNTFGAEGDKKGYTLAAVKFTSMAENAKLTISGNTVYGAGSAFAAFALGDKSEVKEPYAAKFDTNAVVAEGGNFLSVSGEGKAQVYLLGTGNTLNGNNNLYKAVKTASESSFDFIAFEAGSIDGNAYNMYTGKVYLGANFGKGHQFAPEQLAGKVTPGKGHEVWIIDLAFEDPLGFVQHVADYEDHYYVNNVNGLKSFRDMVNGTYKEGVEAKTFQGSTVVQTDNINLNSEPWTPIAVGDSYDAPTLSFRGTYDGGEHSISNIKIVGEHRGVGLFGSVTHNGAVENLTLDGDIQIEGFQDSGALVGYADHASISNITIDAKAGSKITAPWEAVGGVVGNAFSCTLTDITSNLDVESNVMYVGGIVGKVSNGTTTITTATYTGTVHYSDSDSWVGGIVGGLQSNTGEAPKVEIDGAKFSGTIQAKRTEYGIGFSGLVGLDADNGTTAVEQEANYQVTIKNSTSTAQYEDSQYHWSGYQFNTKYDADGNATKEALISTGDALALVSLQAQFGYYNYEGITLKLVNSVSLAEVQSWNSGKGVKWYPIGTKGANPFKGTFDGQGYTISGFVATVSTDNNKPDAFGLFGNTDGATIKNLVLDGVDVTGTDNVGAVIGVAKNSTLIDVSVYGTVTATPTDAAHARSVGALVGAADGLTVSGVYFEGTLTNNYEANNLNYLVYNYGLVGSALEGEATDDWANGKGVLPAAEVQVDSSLSTGSVFGDTAYTGTVNAHITATDLDLSASFFNGTVAHGNANVLVIARTALGLANVAELVNHGVTFEGEDVSLGSDIDMVSYQTNWVGIGNETYAFEGTFNGGYGFEGTPTYKIAHLYGPLFGNLAGTVQHLVLGDLNINKLAGDADATKATVAKVVSKDATIDNVTVDAWVQLLNGVGAAKASDFAAAPFGFYAGTPTVVVTNSNITISIGAVTFAATTDGDGNATVTYTGDTLGAEETASNHNYTAVVNNEIFHLGGFNTNVNDKAPTAEFTFTGIKFTGNSYIDLSAGAEGVAPVVDALTVTNCYADIVPERYSGMYATFILGHSSNNGVVTTKLVFTNNVVLSNESATSDQYQDVATAIFAYATIKDGSEISGNVFGSADKPYHEAVVKFFRIVKGAKITVENNTVYTDAARAISGKSGGNRSAFIDLATSSETDEYEVWMKGNTINVVCDPENAEKAKGYSLVSAESNTGRGPRKARIFITNDNKVNVNGEAVAVDFDLVSGVSTDNCYDFIGYNLVLNDDGKITKGDFIFGHTSRFESTQDKEMAEALKGYVAEGSEADIHIVIGEQFGRRLSDLLAEKYDTYYNFSLVGLNTFASLVNAGSWTGEDKTVKLADELNAEHKLDLGSYESWTPIGNSEHAFKGTFDGSYGEGESAGNWQILNLKYTGTGDLVGFFGHTDGATLSNLDILNTNVTISATAESRSTGALVALAEKTTISGITVTTAELKGYVGNAGAVVGRIDGGSISDITVNGLTIETTDTPNVGAVAGIAKACKLDDILVGVKYDEGDVRKSDADVKITGSYNVGGVVGVAEDGVTIGETAPVYSGAVLKASAVQEATTLQIGGIVGALTVSEGAASSAFNVNNAHFTGTLSRAGFNYTATTKYENYGLVGGYTSKFTGTVAITNSTLAVLHYKNETDAKDTFAQDTKWAADGEVTSEYQITGKEGFKFFRNQVNGGNSYAEQIDNSTLKQEKIHLLADIDLTGEEWIPIGGSLKEFHTKANPFSGIFTAEKPDTDETKTKQGAAVDGYEGYYLRGDSYTIKGLNADMHKAHVNEACETVDGVGLFGYTSGADIMNVNIVGATVTARWAAGVVVGQAWSTNFENITVANATVKAHSFVGGIAGYDDGNAGVWDGRQEVVDNCQVIGLKGQATPEKVLEGETPNFAWGDMVGGLVGHFRANVLTNNLVAESELTAYMFVGGAIGMDNAAYVKIEGNTVKNTTVTTKRSGFTKAENPDDPMMDYGTDYEYKNKTTGDEDVAHHAEWLVGGTSYGTNPHDVNTEGGEWNNNKEGSVTVLHGADKNAKGLIYDNSAWHIVSKEGLETFRTLVNDGATTHNRKTFKEGFEGETVQLECDIDLSVPTVAEPLSRRSLATREGPEEWTPIGTWDDTDVSKQHPFRGVFDGQNYTVSNLIITSADHGYLGFFGYVHNDISKPAAGIKNLTIDGVDIEVKNVDRVAALAGSLDNGGDSNALIISNITITGSVKIITEGDFVGSIAGHMTNAHLSNITVNATGENTLKSTGKNQWGAQVGGLVGHAGQIKADGLTSNLNVEGEWAGGLFGLLEYASTVTDANVTANVTGKTEYVGGLVGAHQFNEIVISESSYKGELKSSASDVTVDAFFGAASDPSGTITVENSTSELLNNGKAPELAGKEGILYGAVADGNGKVTNGYLISSAAGLKAFAELVNGGKDFKGEHVFLTANINLADLGEAWTPIGTDGARFMGTFDGLNHKISNINVIPGSRFVGLFGAVGKNEANPTQVVIKNLIIAGVNTVTVNGTAHGDRNDSGLLVGYAANVAFSNITIEKGASVTVTGVGTYSGNAVGGLVGASQSCTYNGIHANCTIRVNDKSGIMVGGLIGLSMHDSLTDVTVVNAWVDGNFAVGGLIGTAFGSETLTNVRVGGNVYMNFAWYYNSIDTSVYYSMVGGLIGTAELDSAEAGDHSVTISNSLFNGSIIRVNAYALEGDDTLRLYELSDLPNFGLVGSYRSYLKGAQASTVKITSTSITVDSGSSKLSGSLYGDDYILTGGYDEDGTFTVESLSVSSAYGLRYFANLVNSGIDFEGATVTLTQDVDLGGVNWTPIGNDSAHAFKGTFDGGTHTVSGLTIENTTARNTTGLFGNLNNATVKDLTIDNVNIKAPKAEFVGALASGITDSTVTNVTIQNATIVGGTWVGGVVGHMSGNSHVEGCSVTVGTLSVQNYKLGGIVGFVAGNHTEATVSGNTVGSVKLCALKQSAENADDGYGMVGGVVGGTDEYSGVTVSGNRLVDVTIDVSAIGINGMTPGKDGALQATDFRVYERYTGALVSNSGAATYSGNTGSVTVIAPDALMTNKGLSGPCGTEEGKIPTFSDNDIEVIWNGLKAKNDGYYISNEAGMKTFRDMVNGGHDFNGETVYLENDVTLSGEWAPIGTSEKPFKGTFDGQSYTVRGLLIGDGSLQYSTFKVGTLDYAGLFGYTDGNAVIKNVKLSNPVVSGKDSVGALVGHANDHTTIEGVEVIDPIVSGSTSIGGVVGGYFSSVWVKDVKVSGHIVIVGNYKVGGVVGGGYGNIQNATVEAGDLMSHIDGVAAVDENGIVSQLEGDNVGGIIGYTGEGGTYTYDGLTVKNISVMGSRKVGGAVGYYNRANNDSIPNSGFHITNVTVENVEVRGFCIDDYAKDNIKNLFIGAVVGEFCSSVCGGMEHVSVKDVTVEALYTYPSGAQSGTKPSEVVGGTRATDGVLALSDVNLENVTVNSNVQIDSVIDGRIREVSVSTPAQLVWVNEHIGADKFLGDYSEGCGLTINLLGNINMDQAATKTDAQDRQYNWVAMNGQWIVFNGNGHTIKNMKVVADDTGKAGLFGYAGANEVHDLTLENFTAYGTQVGTFSGHSLEGQTITNSYLKGTVNLIWSRKNPTVHAADFTETYCGVGAITGINGAKSSYGVTIDKDCVVTITFDGEFSSDFTNDGEYLVGWSAGESNTNGDPVNNGEIKVQQGTASVNDYALVYSGEYDGEYVVYSANGLAYFRNLVNGGANFAGKTVALHNNINLQDVENGGGTNWEPIGSATHPFYGTFDGREHKISNLVIDKPEADAVGLFGYASHAGDNHPAAYIKNLILENVDVRGHKYVAGVVGSHTYGTLENITVTGEIHVEAMYSHAAAIAGVSYGSEFKDLHVVGIAGASIALADADESTAKWNIYAHQGAAGGIIAGIDAQSHPTFAQISASNISVFVESAKPAEGDAPTGYAGGLVGVVVDGTVTASDVEVRGVQVGANTEGGAAQNVGALVGSVVAGDLTLESYYVSTDSEIVDETGAVVEKSEDGKDVPEAGNDAPVVGGEFAGITDENKFWLDDKTYEGLVLVWKGVSQKVLQRIEVLNETGLGNLNTALAEGRSTDVYLMKSTYDMTGKNFTSIMFTGHLHGNGATIVGLTKTIFSSVYDGAVIEDLTLGEYGTEYTLEHAGVAWVANAVSSGTVEFINCVNNVNVEWKITGASGAARACAFLVGTSGSSIVIMRDCVNNGKLFSDPDDTMAGTNGNHAAAFIGYVQGSRVELYDCINNGDINVASLNDGRHNIGGLISTLQSGSGHILENCENHGNITANMLKEGGNAHAGGLIGRNNSGVTLTNCINTGKVTALGGSETSKNSSNTYAGGFVGCNGATVIGGEIDCEVVAMNYGSGPVAAGALFGTSGINSNISGLTVKVKLSPSLPEANLNHGLFGSNDAPTGSVTNTTLSLVYASDEEGEAGFTQDFAWDAEGAVTVGDYHIYNLAGLKAFRDSVNAGNNYKSATILLEAGFDLGGEEDPWAPIGFSNSEASATFAGTFDGQGYTLTNLYITNLAPENHYNQHLGLFGRVESATICNLTIENAYVFHNDGSNCVAVVVGESFPGAHISDVVVKGTVVVKGGQYTGVIIGKGYVNVENCRVEANDGSYVENYWQYAGGIAGWLGEGSSSISGCYTNIDIRVTKAGYSAIGAVSGIAQANNVIENCIIDGVTLTVERVFSGDDEDSNGVGAIAGRGANNVTLRGNSGEVTVIADKSVRLNYYGLIGNAKQNIPLTGLTLENNDLKINWNNQYSYDDNVWTLGEGADLAKALESAKEGETYVLGADHYTLSAKVSVDNVVIEGVEGTVIDVNPSEGKKTDITGNNVTLKGLTFKAEIGTNNSGSAVQVHGDNFTLEDCSFDVSGTNYVSVQILSGAENVTIKGCHFNGGFKAIGSSCGTKGTTITIDRCTIENGTYGVHFDQTNGAKIVIKDCEIGAWTSFGSTGGGKVEVYNTHFKDGGSYNFFRPYVDTLLDNCTFDGGFKYDAGKAGITITVKNPTFTVEGKDMKNSIGNHTKFTLVVDGEVNRMFED